MEIRMISRAEMPKALELIRKSFDAFIAPDYSQEGVQSFYDTLNNPAIIGAAEFWGAFQQGKPAGVIGSRNNRSHICFFFVAEKFLHQGVGTALFRRFLQESRHDAITVKASPYATEIYHRLGFTDCGAMQSEGGILATPMIYRR